MRKRNDLTTCQNDRNWYIYIVLNAAVVKLVNTLASGARSRKGLGVRVSPAAHLWK